MPNSLKCRLKKLAYQGLLSEKDLSRIYTDNDVITEIGKIKAEIMSIGNWREIYEVPNGYVVECLNIIDKHIAELKGENK